MAHPDRRKNRRTNTAVQEELPAKLAARNRQTDGNRDETSGLPLNHAARVSRITNLGLAYRKCRLKGLERGWPRKICKRSEFI